MNTSTPPTKNPGTIGALILHHTVTAMLVVGALALGIWGYLTHARGGFTYVSQPMAQDATDRYLIASQVHRLTLAAKTYQHIHHSPPLTLDVLVEDELIHADDLRYPSSRVRYELHIEGDQLLVTSSIKSSGASSTEEVISPID